MSVIAVCAAVTYTIAVACKPPFEYATIVDVPSPKALILPSASIRITLSAFSLNAT